MKISGFTMVRNATKYYFPIKESILSILPVVDEFVIALGKGDESDRTREEIEAIGSSKIKIIDRIWSEKKFVDGEILANETNVALAQCKGDWCFYLQADEVIHEKDLATITQACTDNLSNPEVDGLLFNYFHFFGDYDHHLPVHGWYKNEIRIIRNNAGIYSYRDAQSFRKNEDKKLNVRLIDAHVYHYGWVRPPVLMQSKKKEHDSMNHGRKKIDEAYAAKSNNFNYGALGRLPVFKGEHPKVMEDFKLKISWKDELNYSKKVQLNRDPMKHESLKYRLITFLENCFNNGKEIGGFSNWNEIK